MLLTLALIAPSFALDCTTRNLETCTAVNDLQAIVNAEAGGTVISDTAVSRLRPAAIYNQLEAVRATASAEGCRTDGLFEGWTGGIYDLTAGPWSGGFGEFGGTLGDASGTVTPVGTAFFGDYQIGGADAGTIGDDFGVYNAYGQIAANRDDGFMMGRWIRIVGTQGVFVTLHGSCDAGADVATSFDPWYRGDLAPPVTTFNVSVTATPNTAIPDNFYNGTEGSMTCATLPVADTGTVAGGMSLDLTMVHTFVGDLNMKVFAPGGQVLTVMHRPGAVSTSESALGSPFGRGANLSGAFPFRFVDGGLTNAEDMGLNLTSTVNVCEANGLCEFAPNPAIAGGPTTFAQAFDGQSINGNWRFCVADMGSADTGSLVSATLSFTAAP